MRPRDLRALLELMLLPGIGDIRLRRLLRRYRAPGEALDALRRDWRSALGHRPPPVGRDHGFAEDGLFADEGAGAGSSECSGARARRVAMPWQWDSPRTESIRRARAERAASFIEAAGVAVLLERQRVYPKALRRLHAPPPVLFAVGQVALLRRPAVAIVGSRHCTEYGSSAAQLFAAALARDGLVVVSGLARGIDATAHEAALDAGGTTIAVLGSGIDVAYPPEHRHLQERIAREGLLVSEFLPGEPPAPHNFPRRNRVIAALSLATLVVEASEKSGAIITANHAVELHRDVFAVPGPIGRKTSAGTNELIRDGAAMATAPRDILEALEAKLRALREREAAQSEASGDAPSERRAAADAFGGGVRAELWSALESGPLHIDEIGRRFAASASRVLTILLEMELDGFVVQMPGMRFGRNDKREPRLTRSRGGRASAAPSAAPREP